MRFLNLPILPRGDKGYILPATIVLGLATSILAGMFMQTVSNSSQTLNTEAYNIMAKKAADAGIEYAHSCMVNGTMTWNTSSKLGPSTTCTGAATSGKPYIIQNSELRTSFEVSPPDSNKNASSLGKVELLVGGIVTKTFTATSKMHIGASFKTFPVNDGGESLTDIKSQNHTCAIANGKLYCWGKNDQGQIGNNDTSLLKQDVKQPYLVQGALAGKTVTSVDVSDVSTCAIADGLPYCWGENAQGQLGSGNRTNYPQPTSTVPKKSSGVLKDHFVIDISTSPYSWPAIIWPLAAAYQHTCTGLDDGSMSCWGNNGFRQLTTKNSICMGLPVNDTCWGSQIFQTPDSNDPILIEGYTGANGVNVPQKGKKAQRVGASSHDSCLINNGRMYCMGVEVPLAFLCNSPAFLPSNGGMFDMFNICPGLYSGGYDMSAKTGIFLKYTTVGDSGTQFTWAYSLNNKKIDKDSWSLQANVSCGMDNFTMFCVGNSATVGTQWGGSWKPPWDEILNVDATSMDNGDVEWSATTDGIYCIVDRGTPKCYMSALSGILSSISGGGGGVGSWGAMNTTNLGTDTATKIAAGSLFGCLIANGKPYCYGINDQGQIGNGTTNPVNFASQTGKTGSTPIGASDGSLAASDKISVGGSHSCAAVNEKVMCWGDNTYGQLGQGDKGGTLSTPQVVPSLSEYKNVSGIATGENHTCAIIYGELYCWGQNNYGQLGIASGNTTDQSSPTKVTAFNGKRIQYVSAGGDSTCAIANGDLYCWGAGANSKLGLNNTTSYSTPQLVNGKGEIKTTDAITRVSVGSEHICAIGANAEAFCWGNNANGRTGLGTTSGTQNTPKKLTQGAAGLPLGPNDMLPMATEISAGDNFTCGIFNSLVSCWGANGKGQTGNGKQSWNETISDPPYWQNCPPIIILGTVWAPNDSACIDNSHNELLNCVKDWTGLFWIAPPMPSPVYSINDLGCSKHGSVYQIQVYKREWRKQIFPTHTVNHPGNEDILVPKVLYGNAGTYYATRISAGKEHACAIINGNNSATNGNIWCWGAGANGKIGNNTSIDQPTAQLINGGATLDSSGKRRVAVNVSAGGESTCSVANAVVICWGLNNNGQLGNGFTSSSTPITVAGYNFKVPYLRGPVF